MHKMKNCLCLFLICFLKLPDYETVQTAAIRKIVKITFFLTQFVSG